MTAVLVADPVSHYADLVLAGEIVAGPLVRLAARRHLDDLAHGSERGLVWNDSAAASAIALIEQMPLPDGSPFRLEPPQAFIVGSLFGWHRSDGHRRFRTAYVEMGKGNGKTPLAARIGVLGMSADGRADAEVYTAGVTRDQAHYLWNDGRVFIEASAYWRDRIDVGAHNLMVKGGHAFMRPVSSEARSLDQKRVHMALIDEIHEHESPLVVEKMRAGTKGDDDALIFETTNSGYDRTSICWQHHEYSRHVLEGTLQNDEWFGYVACLDEGDDPFTDETCWPKANPLLDVTVTRRYLRGQVQEARDMPAKASLVARLNFCVWTESSAGAIEIARWDTCAGEPLIPAGATVYAGLDLSSTTDLASLILVHERPDGSLDVECRFWCPEAAVEARSRRDHLPYDQWVNAGFIEQTPGDVTDYPRIEAVFRQLAQRYQIAETGFRQRNATQFIQGIGELTTVVPISTSVVGMSAATKDWLARIGGSTSKSPRLHHGGNPVLRWMAANLVVDLTPDGDLKPSTEHSTEQITGQVAAIMALGRLTAPHDPPVPDPGILGLYRTMLAEQPVEITVPRERSPYRPLLGAHEER